jgi:hypothetical protein
MKTIFIIISLLIAVSGFPQQKMNEKQAIKESHIDFTTQYIFFTIHGLVEIDGHTFLNDTCKNPVIFQATIDGIRIYRKSDSTTDLQHRICNKKGCKIIHLQEKQLPVLTAPIPNWRTIPNIQLYNDNIHFDTLKYLNK